jgi:hypothetical protein
MMWPIPFVRIQNLRRLNLVRHRLAQVNRVFFHRLLVVGLSQAANLLLPIKHRALPLDTLAFLKVDFARMEY